MSHKTAHSSMGKVIYFFAFSQENLRLGLSLRGSLEVTVQDSEAI